MIFPDPHVINPKGEHKFTFIFVHGRGSSGDEFAEEFFSGEDHLGQTLDQQLEGYGIKWVFPSARDHWSTVFEMNRPQWFDAKSLYDPEEEQDLQVDGISESISLLYQIIDEELQHVPANRIVIGGISQGFAISILALLTRPEQFLGYVGMSGWLPFKTQLDRIPVSSAVDTALATFFSGQFGLEAKTSPQVLQTPVWISHTIEDDLVAYELGVGTSQTLQQLGMDVSFHEFHDKGPVPHWLQEPSGYRLLGAHLSTLLGRP